MKKIFFILTAFILFPPFVYSQSFLWAKAAGGTNSEIPYGIYVDPVGNSYSTGYFMGTVDFDPGAGVFNLTALATDLFILKLDAAGNFVWAKQVGKAGTNETGNSISGDASGNIYVTGLMSGLNVDFDPGAGVFNLSSLGSYDVFVLKLSSVGNFMWAKSFGSNGLDIGNGIVVDNSNNVYVTGFFRNTADFDPSVGSFTVTSAGSNDIFINKLDVSGNFVSVQTMGGVGGDNGNAIEIDASGNVYSTGVFQGTVDFDPGAGVFNLTGATYVQKLSPSGSFIWAKAMNSTAGTSIDIDNVGNSIVTGYFGGTVDFDPSASVTNLTSNGSSDVFIQKLDISGNFVWAKNFGGIDSDIPSDIVVDGSNNIYTIGTYSLNCDFDPGAGTFTMTASAMDFFIQKLDPSGNFSWAKSIGGAMDDVAASIGLDFSGNIYITGNFLSTVDFDPGPGNFFISAVGSWDIFVLKLASCASAPSTPGAISGLSSQCIGAGASTYSISLLTGATSYSWSLPGGWSGSSATNTISATPGSTGVFTVTASNACGTSSQQTLNVTINPLPTITVNSGSICSGNSFTIVPSGANTYTIQGGSSVVSPTANATYTVSGTSTAGCVSASSATSNITVNTLPTISVNSGSICSGNSFTINPSGANTYTIQGGSSIVSPTANATYTVSGTSTAGCVSASSATSNVIVNTTPTISVNSGSICAGQSFTMVASGANTYTYQGGSSVVSPTTNASYTVSGTSTQGCVSGSAAMSNVTVSPLPTINASTNNTLICVGQSATLTASGANTYTWNPGGAGTSIIVSPTVTATYTITGTSTAGCNNSSTFTQSVSTCAGIQQITNTNSEILIFPNPFSNKITIVSNGAKQALQIFNALGSVVYNTIIENEKSEIDLSQQPSGIYFIRIGSATKKLIKE